MLEREQPEPPAAPVELRTERLLLRRWGDADLEPFAELNADSTVMEYFTGTLSRVESDALVGRIVAGFEQNNYGLWAIEEQSTGRFAGFVGLAAATFLARFTPAVEVGWRLARWCWGQGFAPEAASASVADGFERLDIDEIVSFTAAVNNRSRRVMEKIGMRHDTTADFDHPSCLEHDLIRQHVLYRIPRP